LLPRTILRRLRTTDSSSATAARRRAGGGAARAGAGVLLLLGVTAGVEAMTDVDAPAAPTAARALATVGPLDDPALRRQALSTTARAQAQADQARQRAAREASRSAARRAERAAAARREAEQKARRDAARRSAQQRVARSRAVVPTGDPRSIARQLLAARGWSGQFGCLDALWQRESNWNHRAANPSSGAYGIPQALPAGKMASAGADWQTNPATQIRWGLGYIAERYGSPCAAWGHSQSHGWY
jgi:hypothetical protein